MDFVRARMKHMCWKLKLRNFLRGGSSLTEAEATSPEECDLGKWLRSTGYASFAEVPCLKQLENVHAEMHATVANVIRYQNSGNKIEAERKFLKVNQLSGKILALLDEAERSVKN